MRVIESSELIINNDGSIFHLHISPGACGYCDSGWRSRGLTPLHRTFKREFRRSSREFVTITGTYKGKRMTVLSTGIGTDNIDIVMNELDALVNIDLRKRVVNLSIKPHNIKDRYFRSYSEGYSAWSVCFSDISIGFDGLLNWYDGRNNVCDREMEQAFTEHACWPDTLVAPILSLREEGWLKL